MSRALRRAVPLNAMCSKKCAAPLTAGASCRVPTSTQMPSEAVSTVSTRSVTIRIPFASCANFVVMLLPVHGLRTAGVRAQKTRDGAGIVRQYGDPLALVHDFGER